MGVRLWGEPLGRILRVGGICGIYSLSVVTMVALAYTEYTSATVQAARIASTVISYTFLVIVHVQESYLQ